MLRPPPCSTLPGTLFPYTTLVRSFRAVGLHAAAAVLRAARLAADRLHRAGSLRHRAAAALRPARAEWPRQPVARTVLEHAGERRRLCHRLPAQPSKRHRAHPGGALRRRLPPCRRPERVVAFLARDRKSTRRKPRH